MMMASTTLIKDRGFLLFLVGLLVPAVFVSGVTTVSSSMTTSNATMANATSQWNMTNTQSTTSGAMTQSTSSSKTTGWTTQSTSTSMMTTKSTDGMSTTYTPAAICCPSFTCNYSNCYDMYNSQNETWCVAGSYCQLTKQTDMSYIANCSLSCGDKCVNDSQINCFVACCKTIGCLNGTFASMMMTTTTTVSTTAMTSTTTATTTTTAAPTTTTIAPNNGNECHAGVCDGETCYTQFKLTTCSDSEPHCQLKKGSGTPKWKWTAGCTSDCSQETTCQDQVPPPCHLECCNSTKGSCLNLDGKLNVFSFATRGPYLHTELTASLLCLLVVAIML